MYSVEFEMTSETDLVDFTARELDVSVYSIFQSAHHAGCDPMFKTYMRTGEIPEWVNMHVKGIIKGTEPYKGEDASTLFA